MTSIGTAVPTSPLVLTVQPGPGWALRPGGPHRWDVVVIQDRGVGARSPATRS